VGTPVASASEWLRRQPKKSAVLVTLVVPCPSVSTRLTTLSNTHLLTERTGGRTGGCGCGCRCHGPSASVCVLRQPHERSVQQPLSRLPTCGASVGGWALPRCDSGEPLCFCLHSALLCQSPFYRARSILPHVAVGFGRARGCAGCLYYVMIRAVRKRLTMVVVRSHGSHECSKMH
jgi:hypothetical protein